MSAQTRMTGCLSLRKETTLRLSAAGATTSLSLAQWQQGEQTEGYYTLYLNSNNVNPVHRLKE